MLEFWIKVEPGVAVTVKWFSRPFKGPNGARTIASKTATCNGSWWCWWLLSWLIKKEKITWFSTFSSLPSKKGIPPVPVLPFSLQRSQSGSFLCMAAPKVEQPVNGGWVGCKFPTHRGAFPSLGQFVLRLVKMGHIYGSVNGGWVGGVQISNTPRCVSSWEVIFFPLLIKLFVF